LIEKIANMSAKFFDELNDDPEENIFLDATEQFIK
jgi:hypothetical protein